MGDVEGVEDEEEGEDGGVDVEVPLGPGPLQVDERRNHWVTDQPEKRVCLCLCKCQQKCDCQNHE